MPDILQYQNDADPFPDNYMCISDFPLELIQKCQIAFTIRNHNAENYLIHNNRITKSNTSLEESQTKQHDVITLVHSEPMYTNPNKTTKTDFNSILLDD